MINTKKILAIFTSVCLVTTMFFPVFSFAQIDNANTKEIGEKPTVETNWSEIDWDSRMTLPSDQEAYNEQARELEREMDYGGVKTLVLGKSRISDDDSMEEMEVPEEVRVLVREYRDGLGIYAKKSAKSKKVLKSRISYVYPQEEREVISDIKAIDVSKEKLLNIKQENLHGVKNIDEAEVNVAIKRVIDGPKSKFDLSKFTLPKIKENAGKAIFQNRVEEKELGFWGKVKAFFIIKTAQAEIVTPIIEYYEGIEDNQLDLLQTLERHPLQ